MNKSKHMQILVTKDAANPSRFMAEVKPSNGTNKSRRQVGSRMDVTRFAGEHGVDAAGIEWNGLFDHLPEHKAQAATARK